MSSVPEGYIELGLRLGRHVDGLVDSYFGPAEIAERIDAESLTEPKELVADAAKLLERVDDAWLQAQLDGLQTVARKLAGEEIPYADEVELCYGVRPTRAPDKVFEAAHERLAEVLPADGSLSERYQRWREGNPVAVELLPRLLHAIASDLRQLTTGTFGLPSGEDAELDFVTDEPWWAYNYYLGGLRSRIAVNTDVPLSPAFAIELMAHEIYPGHHTEHAWKESLLFRDRGQVEESLLLIGTPQSMIAEGIAGLGIELLVDDQDALAAQIFGTFGIEYDAETGSEIREARRPLDRVFGNVALLLHEDGASTDEAKEYIQRWGLVSEERALHNVEFATHPIWRSYVTTYADGYYLCRDWVNGDPGRFRRLLTEQLTPADLA